MSQKNSKIKRTCTICRKEYSDTKYQPFCSKRCADIDLGKWLGEKYSIPYPEGAVDDLEENQ